MSPEQATGDQHIGPATDIYALDCVLYEMLVGEPPYMGRTAQAVLGRIIVGETPSASAERSSVPANVDATIAKAVEKVPADRFSTAVRFSEALADWSFGSDMPDYGSQGKRQTRVPASRHFTVALTVLALMTLASCQRNSARYGLIMRSSGHIWSSIKASRSAKASCDPAGLTSIGSRRISSATVLADSAAFG